MRILTGMSNALLREYVSLVLEKVKSQRGKHARGGGHFDLRQFKTLETSHIMLDYAGRYLQEMGRGTSRAAFVLTNRSVLKVALNSKGVAQNETELDVFTNPKTKAIIARILDADNKGRWLISELVKPLRSEDEFERLTGIEFDDMDAAVVATYREQPVPEHLRGNPFIQALVTTMREASLLPGDLVKVDSWGQTPDGRAVLLDYGFTGEVWDKHYSLGAGKTAGPEQATRNARVGVVSAKTRPDNSGDARTQKLAPRAPQTHTLKAA